MPKSEITDEEFKEVFKMKPEAAIEFFESKGLKTSFNWHEVYEDAHAKAFTVAKMTELDLLKDTKDLLQKALDEGKSFSSFKKEARELFAQKGWLGKQEVTNPHTGEKQTAELGTPRRIKTIYDCNMRSAYSVGRYKEMLEEVDVAPYFQYKSLMDGRERPAHRAMHDRVFRADDPFWNIFFPPNGWGCRCYVINLTKKDIEKMGLNVEKSEGKIEPVKVMVGGEEKETQSFKFENAGKMMTLVPDAGWGTNLGVQAWGIDVQAWNKVQDLPEKIKYQFISKMAENPHNEEIFKTMVKNIIDRNFKTNKKNEKVVNWLEADIVNILIKNKIEPKTPIVVLQESQVPHIIGNREKLVQEELMQAYQIIKNPDNIYIDYTKANTGSIGLAYTKNISNSDDCIKVCIKLSKKSKTNNDIVNYISTAGKVKKDNMTKAKNYKKIK